MERFDEWLAETSLARHEALLRSYLAPAIGFRFAPAAGADAPGASRWGGRPDVPADFDWPMHGARPLDFLIQIALDEIQTVPAARELPERGLLAFFYDLETQPWGYDPAETSGSRVCYFPDRSSLVATPRPGGEELAPHGLEFFSALTLPEIDSRPYDELNAAAQLSDDEFEDYVHLNLDLFTGDAEDEDAPRHHLLGHAANIQGDMQWEAQMVSHGVNCGGVVDVGDDALKRRVAELEPGCGDWRLLLQLDSDDAADLMWGDAGRLYFWIRSQDLAAAAFDRTWTGLQCY